MVKVRRTDELYVFFVSRLPMVCDLLLHGKWVKNILPTIATGLIPVLSYWLGVATVFS